MPVVYLHLRADVHNSSATSMSFTFGFLIFCCACSLTGEIHSSIMPWRSNTGVPFGNTNFDNRDGSESSEASGFSGDASFGEPQPSLFGDLHWSAFEAEECSAVDSQPIFLVTGDRAQLHHIAVTVDLAAPVSTQLGRALLDTSGQLPGGDMIACFFDDAFRNRATANLVKRSWDYYKMALCVNTSMNLQPMQLAENVVCRYLSFLRESGAAPTSADATVKALWFMHATATIVDFSPDDLTSRITGVCRDMFLKERNLRQAPPFPAEVAWALEVYALGAGNRADSIFTNFFLFCTFSSCRIGDAAKIREVSFSRFHAIVLVEAMTSAAKNTNTMERLRMVPPFTAVGWGLHFNPWCIKWEMQLRVLQLGTIILAFSSVSGQFLKGRITTAEAAFGLRVMLVCAGLTPEQAARFSTCGCKATIPTWAYKFGGFSMDERCMLTHHMDASSVMPLFYSRDNLTALHFRVFRMLTAIRNFEFDFDVSDAARIYQEDKHLRDEPVEPPLQQALGLNPNLTS